MYFFRIELSSFDDEEKTLYIIPEQTADEQGVPFNEKFVTQTAEYKAFVKETGTSIVDGVYTQFETSETPDKITDEDFKQLQSEGKLTELDSNTFFTTTSYKPKRSGGGKLDMKTFLMIGGFALVAVILMIASVTLGGKGNDSETPSAVESTESVESSEPDASTDNDTSESNSDTTDSTVESTESSELGTSPDSSSEPEQTDDIPVTPDSGETV